MCATALLTATNFKNTFSGKRHNCQILVTHVFISFFFDRNSRLWRRNRSCLGPLDDDDSGCGLFDATTIRRTTVFKRRKLYQLRRRHWRRVKVGIVAVVADDDHGVVVAFDQTESLALGLATRAPDCRLVLSLWRPTFCRLCDSSWRRRRLDFRRWSETLGPAIDPAGVDILFLG